MKFYNKIFAVSICMLLFTASCSDYLDVPVNGVLTQESFYESDKDVNAAILSAYDILTWNNNNWGWAAPLLVKTFPSDEGTAGGASPTDQPGYDSLDDYDYDSSNSVIEGMWNLAYFGVHRCNILLDNVEGDTPFKAQAIGEALGLRAYNYLELVSYFGGVPLLTSTDIRPSEYDQPRADVSAVYAQIESDLLAAIAVLPTKAEYSAADQFRMSKGACQGYLAKAYMNQGKYAEALAAVNDVVGSGAYALAEDFSSIFKLEGEFGSGSMFEAVFTPDVGYNWGTNPWDLGIGERNWESNMHIQLMGPREGEFGDAADLGVIQGWGFNYPSEKLYNAYLAEGDEVRRLATVISEDEWIAGGGTATGAAYDYTGYLRIKYGSIAAESNEVSLQQNYGTNWRLLRYADVLLVGAEAAARTGNESQALQYLNMVRERAGLAASSASGDALLGAIVNERFLELAFEGFRFNDLVRWGMAADNIEGFEDKHNLFPIPANELVRAPSMTQNPGW